MWKLKLLVYGRRSCIILKITLIHLNNDTKLPAKFFFLQWLRTSHTDLLAASIPCQSALPSRGQAATRCTDTYRTIDVQAESSDALVKRLSSSPS